MEDYIEKLKTIKPHIGHLSADERQAIREMVDELEIEVKLNGRCQNCYTDAFYLIINKLGLTARDLEIRKDTPSNDYSYTLNETATWYSSKYGKTELNENTDTDTIERYIAENPNQKLFIKK